MSQLKTLPNSYVQMAIRALANQGVSADQVLHGTDLTVDNMLDNEFIPLEQFVKVILNTKNATKNPAIGLLLGSLLHPSTHGSVGWAAINSPTLSDAIDIFQRYSQIRTPFIFYNPITRGDQYIIRLTLTENLDEAHMVFVEAMLMLLQHVIEFILGRPMGEAALHINSATPDYADSYADYFHCPVYFDADYLEIRLPLTLKDTLNPNADPQMFQMALEQCRETAHQLLRNINVSTEVHDYLSTHLGDALTIEQLAELFNMSSRTLIRKLKQQNTSFQRIKDEVYAFQASYYLRYSNISVDALSLVFGYRDAANFRRSFKRWFGISPQQFRHKKQTK